MCCRNKEEKINLPALKPAAAAAEERPEPETEVIEMPAVVEPAPHIKNIKPENVYFGFGSAVLDEKSKNYLAELAEELKGLEYEKVIISGHTDSAGPAAANERLSAARAKSAAEYLKSRGLDAAKMELRGEGPHRPIADNKTAAGRSVNRRVELIVE